MLNWLLSLDTRLFRLINEGWHCRPFDFFLSLISDFKDLWIPLAVVGVLLLIFGRFRERLLVLMAVLAVLIGGCLVDLVKPGFHRPRPYEALSGVRRVKNINDIKWYEAPSKFNEGKSFPSAHVANNTAVAWLIIWLYSRRRRFLIWIWVGLMALSRVYTGYHYPLDVLGGFVIATAYTWCLAMLAEWIWSAWGRRVCPRLHASHCALFPSLRAAGRRSEKISRLRNA